MNDLTALCHVNFENDDAMHAFLLAQLNMYTHFHYSPVIRKMDFLFSRILRILRLKFCIREPLITFRVHNLHSPHSKMYDLIPRLFRYDKSRQS